MSDTLITVIAIALAAVLMFIFPLMTTADRADDTSQLTVQAAISEFTEKVASTGKITQENYDMLVQTITSTGNTYDVNIAVQVLDTNLGKKVSMAKTDKIGENVYYTIYTSQIEDALNANGIYYCKEGDIVTVSLERTSQTIYESLENFFYTVTGNSSAKKVAEKTAMVQNNGN